MSYKNNNLLILSFWLISILSIILIPINAKSAILYPGLLALSIWIRPKSHWITFFRRNKSILIYYMLFVLYVSVVWIFSPFKWISLQKSIPFLLYFFILFPFLDEIWHSHLSIKQTQKILFFFKIAFAISSVLIIIAILIGHFTNIAIYQTMYDFHVRPFPQYNEATTNFAMLSFIVLAFFMKRIHILWVIAFYIAMTLFSYFANGASPMMIMILGGVIFFVTYFSEKLVYWILNILIWALWLVVPLTPYFYTYGMKWNFLDFSAKDRFEIWAMNLQQILHGLHTIPGWLGRGFGSEYSGLRIDLWPSRITRFQCTLNYVPHHPHNYVFELLFELGPIGLLLVTLIMHWILKTIHTYHNPEIKPAAYAIFIGYMLMLCILVPLWHFSQFYMCVFALPLILKIIDVQSPSIKQK